ncbi:MAG: ethylbenzene dehydrogenase-related protein [Gaiella sp.]
MSEPITRRDLLTAAGTVGAVGAGALGFAGVIGLVSDDETATETLTAASIAGPVPVDDPLASAWDDAPEVVAPLLAQQVAPPALDTLGVSELAVRALTDGTDLAFRVTWEDETRDDLDSVDGYHDAVAVMLPPAPGPKPAITMGAAGSPVHILQWRATWQRDVDSQGKTGVDQIYPRVVHDVMPDDVLPPEVAGLYWVGREAGNPLSQVDRTTPVEQIVAEGFGTTTHLPRTDAHGRGAHDGTSWSVVLGLPVAREGLGAPLRPGEVWWVAFAVWLGDQRNRGGRKHYADWVPLRLESA